MIDYAIHCVSARAFSSSFGSLARRCVLVFVDGPSTASQASPWRCSRMTQAVSRATARRTERWETESLMERLNRMLAGWGRYYCLGSPRRIEPWMLTCDIGCVDGYGTSTSAGDGPRSASPTSSSTARWDWCAWSRRPVTCRGRRHEVSERAGCGRTARPVRRAGAGNVTMGAGLRPGAKATESPPDPTVGAPVLDSTWGSHEAMRETTHARGGQRDGSGSDWVGCDRVA